MKTSIVIILFLCLIPPLTYADEVYTQQDQWGVFSSRYCTIFYEKDVNLKSVNRHLNLGFSDFYSSRRFKEKVDLSIEEILSEKFDAIFIRVEDILDMYPSNIHVTINIYKRETELDAIYEELFDEPNTAISFYIYKTNTIYTTQNAIDERILAHEMAHCIIDHYFVILPPKKIQEILAVYADVHLSD